MINVVIIGAPRSGTNMLRDALASLDEIGTWPCDEINYIWRHGNVNFPSDEIPVSQVTPAVIAYIRQQFETLHRRLKTRILLEKTCANCLRVPFVNQVVPAARYIYIHRDGIDAAVSAQARWTAALDLSYILKKVRFVPKSDLPIYGVRYVWSRFYRLFSQEKRLAFWGPKLNDMEYLLNHYSLIEVCAIQWQRCVEAAESAFADIPSDRILRVSYETFVHHPARELQRILDFLDCPYSETQINTAIVAISDQSVGRGRTALARHQLEQLEQLVGQTLERYGYV
jgi:hypothetical protein